MKILVTGGAGFIGSHYVRTMLSGGYPGYEDAAVTVLDSLTYAGNPANLAPVSASRRLRFVRGDIADAALVRSLVPGHDAVINFAAETHVDRSIAGAAPFVTTNVAGLQVLLQTCLVNGMPPGYMDGLGIGYRQLKEINPRMVYVWIGMLGQWGPWKDKQSKFGEWMLEPFASAANSWIPQYRPGPRTCFPGARAATRPAPAFGWPTMSPGHRHFSTPLPPCIGETN